MPGNIVVGILRALLTADTAEFTDGIRQAVTDSEAFGKGMQAVGKQIKAVGEAVMPISLAVAAIGTVSVKAAMDFESSFAGIRKTVGDATDAQGNLTAMGQQLLTGMRDMAKQIPVNVNELNNIGQAAGQLGIKSENILSFTRVMADLGVSTNLSSEQAATALARLANITQMPQENFGRLGSTIVALGNNMATTESEIAEFGLRIAGAGHQVGMSEAQIMSIGAALSSVGINAEAGGTAISKVMINMALAVQSGGKDLKEFADVAGVSSAQFKQQFQTDAAGALTAFIAGLGNMQSHGKSTLAVLDEMGITEVRMRDALLRSAGAGDLLAESLRIGTKAWEDNTALTKEAEQRYKTFESQLTILWNQFKDVAITLGTAMLPVLKEVIELFRSWIPTLEAAAKWFTELSPEMQTTVLAVGAFVAALGPALVALGAFVAAVGAAIPVIVSVGGALLAFISGPIGLTLAALAGLALAWHVWGDDVTKFVSDTFHSITHFFVDIFNDAVESVRKNINAVTGFFKGMYEDVVGHSHVPDMIDGIRKQFAKLPNDMVAPAEKATAAVQLAYAVMAQDMVTQNVHLGKAVLELRSTFDTTEIKGFIDTMGALQGEVGATDIAVSKAVGGMKGSLDGLVGGFQKGLGDLWEGMSGGKGFAGLMGNLGDSLVSGFGNILSGGLTSVINMGIGLAVEGVKKLAGIIGGMFQSEETKVVSPNRDKFFGQYGGEAETAAKLTAAMANAGVTESGNAADVLMRALYAADTKAKSDTAQNAIRDWIGGRSFELGTPGLQAVDFGAGQLAMLHGPEFVVPESRLGEFVAQHGPDQIINIYQDGVLMTQRVVRNMPRVLALHGVG